MDSSTIFVIGVISLILVLWVFREIVLWYYKINDRLEQQIKQTELLTKIYSKLVQIEIGISGKEEDVDYTEIKGAWKK